MRLRESFELGKERYSVYYNQYNQLIHYTYDELYYMRLRERFQIGKNRYSVYLKSFIRNIHYTYDELYCMRLRERFQIGKRDTVYTKNDLIERYTTPITNFTI
jgi:hypothetical protein